MSVIRSRRDPPTFSVPALKSGKLSVAIEWMSSWVGSWWSCCHRGTCPRLGVLSGYGRRFHPLVGGAGGVGVGGLAWGVGGLGSESDVGSELVLSGSEVGVGGPALT